MELAGFIVLVLGVVLVVIGTIVSLIDYFDKRSEKRGHRGVETKPTATAKQINALRRFIEAIGKQPVGIQLIGFGILLILIGTPIAGVGSL